MMNIEIPAINSIQQYLFDILAFFSNCQVNSIAEYCQESQNVGENECIDWSMILFSGVKFNDLLMMKIFMFFRYFSVILRREIDLINDQRLVRNYAED